MNTLLTRTIVAAMTLTFIIGAAYPGQTHAVLGIADIAIVNDPIHTAKSIAGWIGENWRFFFEMAAKTFLETLKKRLLDTLTDQIIAWIQGNGDPRFLTDFGGVFGQSLNESIGETIREVGLAELCEQPLSLRLQLSVGRPPQPFSRAARCTLDDVVGNITAFKRDFQNGRWIGLQSLAAPENNRFGLRLLAMEQVILETERKESAARTEVVAGQGYKSEQECRQWSRLISRQSVSGEIILQTLNPGDLSPPWQDSYYNPKTPPPYNAIPSGFLPEDSWTCSNLQTTTPASNIKTGGDKLLYSEFDRITGSQELAESLAAIADAALNRLFAEGARGLLSLVQSEHSTGNPPPPLQYATPIALGNLQNATTTYGQNQQNFFAQNKQAILQQIDAALQQSGQDIAALPTVQSNLNFFIDQRLLALYSCLLACDPPPPDSMALTWGWTNNVSSTAWSARAGLADLQVGYWSLASTTRELTALRASTTLATTLSDLAALNQASITAAQENAADLEGARSFVQNQTGALVNRTRYCIGDPLAIPPINQCSQIFQ